MNLYVAMASYGEYDSFCQKAVMSCLDKPTLEQWVKDAEQASKLAEVEAEKYRRFCDNYHRENPPPSFSSLGLEWHKYPKWPKGLLKTDITDAMRQERADIDALNMEASNKVNQAVAIWHDAMELAVANWCKDNISPINAEWFYNNSANPDYIAHNYEIVEVPFLGNPHVPTST